MILVGAINYLRTTNTDEEGEKSNSLTLFEFFIPIAPL